MSQKVSGTVKDVMEPVMNAALEAGFLMCYGETQTSSPGRRCYDLRIYHPGVYEELEAYVVAVELPNGAGWDVGALVREYDALYSMLEMSLADMLEWLMEKQAALLN